MYKNVIFDLDGTLLDTLQDLASACNHTLEALGLPTHPVDAYRKMVGSGIPKLIERMLPPEEREGMNFTLARSMFESYYAQHMRDLTQPYPGIKELLAKLSAAGVVMGVASNKKDDFTKEMVKDYFPKTFRAVVGLRDDMMPKPDPAVVHWLLKEMAAAPDATLYVGDSDVDMHTAIHAQLHPCGVLWGFRDRDELFVGGARYLVESPAQLERLILAETPDPALMTRPPAPAAPPPTAAMG